MRVPRVTKKAAKSDRNAVEPAVNKKSPQVAEDERLSVCLGEFGIEQAREFRALWEATWSQDVRIGSKKK